MAFPENPNPLPAPTGTVHVIIPQFPHQGSWKGSMCVRVHVL